MQPVTGKLKPGVVDFARQATAMWSGSWKWGVRNLTSVSFSGCSDVIFGEVVNPSFLISSEVYDVPSFGSLKNVPNVWSVWAFGYWAASDATASTPRFRRMLQLPLPANISENDRPPSKDTLKLHPPLRLLESQFGSDWRARGRKRSICEAGADVRFIGLVIEAVLSLLRSGDGFVNRPILDDNAPEERAVRVVETVVTGMRPWSKCASKLRAALVRVS